MPARVVLRNVRLDDGNGLAVDGCSLIIEDERIATANVPPAASGDQVVDLQGRTVAVVTRNGGGRDALSVAPGRRRDARLAGDPATGPVMHRIWSWPPARLWPPAERG
jgi:hypothetical protein